jgi:hypothetical protein
MEPAESELAKLHALAAVVLGKHQNNSDLCAICGTAWPCQRVVLADHNLAVD